MSAKRVIAVALVAIASTITGPLATTAGADATDPVRIAFERTLASDSFRVTTRADGEIVTKEDWRSPDRVRSTSTTAGGGDYETLFVGRDLYALVQCQPGRRPLGYQHDRMQQPLSQPPSTELLDMLTRMVTSTSAETTASGAQQYTFDSSYTTTLRGRTFTVESGRAVVKDGRLVSATLETTLPPLNGANRHVTGVLEFSRFGAVPRIDRPAKSEITKRRCPGTDDETS